MCNVLTHKWGKISFISIFICIIICHLVSDDKPEEIINDPLRKFVSENSENGSSSLDTQDSDTEEEAKMSSVLPTMWLGSQDGQLVDIIFLI